MQMMASLLAHEDVINTCKEQYAALEGVVMQRLRWAAGANPSLNVTLQHFQEASSMRTQLLEASCMPLHPLDSYVYGIEESRYRLCCLRKEFWSFTNISHLNPCVVF